MHQTIGHLNSAVYPIQVYAVVTEPDGAYNTKFSVKFQTPKGQEHEMRGVIAGQPSTAAAWGEFWGRLAASVRDEWELLQKRHK